MTKEKEVELKEALSQGTLFDFVAQNYGDLTKWELKEITLAILGVVYDNCGGGNATGDADFEAFQEQVEEELHDRTFFEEDWDED